MLSITSCSEEEIIHAITFAEGSIDYSKNSLNFSSDAGQQIISFNSNVPWTASVVDKGYGSNWCRVTPDKGEAGMNSIVVSVDDYNAFEDRNVAITLSTGDLKKKIEVVQKQKDALTLTSNKFEIPSNGGSFIVQVSANVDYQVIIADDCKEWLHQVGASRSLVASELQFTVDPNVGYDKRDGKIVIINEDSGLSEEVLVSQSQNGVIFLDQQEFSFDENGGTFTVNLNSNIEYQVKIGDSWVSEISTPANRGLSASYHTFNVSKLTSKGDRETKIYFVDNVSGIEEEVVVKQSNTFCLEKENDEIVVGDVKYLILTNKTGSKATWESSNNAVATVDGTGKVKAIAAGKTTITVSTADGKHKATCDVVVCTVESKVTLSGGTGGYAMTVINGVSYRGYFNEFEIKNDLPSNISVTKCVYYYNGKEIYSSTDTFSVSANSSKSWQIRTNNTQYSKVNCKVTFKYKAVPYTIEL